jgi:hypothetical protein
VVPIAMKRCLQLLLLLGVVIFNPTTAYAQCTGQFVPGGVCGNPNATQGQPSAGVLSPLIDRNFGAPSAQGTVLNRGASNWGATITPVLGNPGTTTGSLGLASSVGGIATITPPAIVGNTTLQLPSTAGTIPTSALSPILLNSVTGVLSCPTCVTGTGGALAINSTGVSGAAAGRVLFSDGSLLQAYPITGTTNVVLSNSPTFTGTPNLATPIATSLALGGATIGTNALAVTGTTQLNNALTYGGVTFANTATGTGSLVGSIQPVLEQAFGLFSTMGGTAIILPPALAINTTFHIPTLSGTFPSTATSPLSLDATTGVLSCSTCLTGLTVNTTAVSGASAGQVLQSDGTKLQVYSVTGTGNVALSASPTFTGSPALSTATATSINGLHLTASTGTLTVTDSKTLTVNNSISLSGTDGTTWTGPTTNATLASLNIADQVVTGGANVTTLAQATGNLTVDCGSRPTQSITNGGAFTITAPSNDGYCVLLVTNNASAGTITFSGFSVGTNTGDTLTTTNGNKFMIFIYRVSASSTYSIKALQ